MSSLSCRLAMSVRCWSDTNSLRKDVSTWYVRSSSKVAASDTEQNFLYYKKKTWKIPRPSSLSVFEKYPKIRYSKEQIGHICSKDGRQQCNCHFLWGKTSLLPLFSTQRTKGTSATITHEHVCVPHWYKSAKIVHKFKNSGI